MVITRRRLLLGGLSAGAGALILRATGTAHAVGPLTTGLAGTQPHDNPVIDVHAHWYPPEWMALLKREGPGVGAKIGKDERGWTTVAVAGINTALSPAHIDLATRLQRMDEMGVDMHALSLSLPMVYWAPPPLGLQLSQVFNDACSEAHLKHPKRFVGLAIVPMQAPDLAVRELERAAKLAGLRGLYMATNVNGKNLDEKGYLPVFAKCAELGWPVFLHPVDPLGADRMRSYYLRNLLGNPYDTGLAAASLVFGGVMDAFPNLDVVLPHSGGAFPALVGRLDHGAAVRPELKHMKRTASSYLRRFHYDTIDHSPELLLNLVRQVGADRVVLGSDFPFDMGYDKPVQVVERLSGVSPDDRTLILGNNAARLLRI